MSLQRLSFDETEGRLLYQYDKGKQEPESMDYLEFIARVTSHIPDKGQVIIRYYGLYSNAHRGKMRKAGVDPSHLLFLLLFLYFLAIDLAVLCVICLF